MGRSVPLKVELVQTYFDAGMASERTSFSMLALQMRFHGLLGTEFLRTFATSKEFLAAMHSNMLLKLLSPAT